MLLLNSGTDTEQFNISKDMKDPSISAVHLYLDLTKQKSCSMATSLLSRTLKSSAICSCARRAVVRAYSTDRAPPISLTKIIQDSIKVSPT